MANTQKSAKEIAEDTAKYVNSAHTPKVRKGPRNAQVPLKSKRSKT
jgi:hypothetical protein